jgi:HD-GYP domain-containing protein (c-di-GMP phosphodiesterase class II)
MAKTAEAGVSDTQVLMNKIVALRQQLEQVQGLATDADSASVAPVKAGTDGNGRVWRLERHVATGSQHAALLDSTLRQLTAGPAPEVPALPKQLTARARRILEQGRSLLSQLRVLADAFESDSTAEQNGTENPVVKLGPREIDPLARRYQETVAMAETALRMVQAFPDAPSVQLRLCAGLEAILGVTAEHVTALTAAVRQRQRATAQVDTLAQLLTALHAGQPVDIQAFVNLVEVILTEAQEGAPLRFLSADARQPAQFIACHSLTVAQVIARVARYDPDFRSAPREPVLAALLHDAGMLAVSPDILAHAGQLDDKQRRAVEAHATIGAELMTRLLPTGAWLADAAAGHHERLDGTGYPGGARDARIASLTRLLSLCDIYAALCTPRPYRPARDTRTALVDTLLLAEQGALDRSLAERLLQLSFYPVGSVVELADGAVGVVVATHLGRRDLNSPARPVLAVLTDGQGQPLPAPRHLDLAQCEHQSIVRTLPAPERQELLGHRYPEWV